jgi:DNA-directed RNA polymerase specialized sigma24 family protein
MSSLPSWDIPQDAFNRLLAWLGQNPEAAGKKYEEIRRRLIKIFTCRCCDSPEDLADETINRVAAKVDELAGNYVGEPALFFYGVAKMVYLEYLRKRAHPVPPPAVERSEENEQTYKCLEHCMQSLPPRNHDLVLNYFREEKRAKIEYRKELARELGITLNGLRIKVHRIVASLHGCVLECLKAKSE